MSLIISGFPGIGKTTLINQIGNINSFYYASYIIDLESSQFSREEFPKNYVKKIKELISEEYPPEYIFTSSHKTVRDALENENIDFVLVYPDIELKNEYIDRYKKRGNSEAFCKLLEENWSAWIEEMHSEVFKLTWSLRSNEYLSDVLMLVKTVYEDAYKEENDRI